MTSIDDRSTGILMTLDEVAKALRLSPRTVWQHTQSGKLRGLKVGGVYRFTRADVDAFLESCRVGGPSEASKDGHRDAKGGADE